jgi:hypothetical protein
MTEDTKYTVVHVSEAGEPGYARLWAHSVKAAELQALKLAMRYGGPATKVVAVFEGHHQELGVI